VRIQCTVQLENECEELIGRYRRKNSFTLLKHNPNIYVNGLSKAETSDRRASLRAEDLSKELQITKQNIDYSMATLRVFLYVT
jgi:hypothetical protein